MVDTVTEFPSCALSPEDRRRVNRHPTFPIIISLSNFATFPSLLNPYLYLSHYWNRLQRLGRFYRLGEKKECLRPFSHQVRIRMTVLGIWEELKINDFFDTQHDGIGKAQARGFIQVDIILCKTQVLLMLVFIV